MGFKQHISRTWQMIEQQVNDVPFRPDDEILTERKKLKSPYLCGFQDLARRRKIHLYIKLTSNGAEFRAEMKKSHNF